MTGVELIECERLRQTTEEGRTAEHDDRHDAGQLLAAAMCYLVAVEWRSFGDDPEKIHRDVGESWPWDLSTFKPTDDERDLARAGALIAAELDRIRRATAMLDGAAP